MDLAAVFLLSLLGGYYFAYWWRLTAYATRRVDGHHVYFRAALCGAIFFAIALGVRRLLLLNPSYGAFDARLIQYVIPILKDDSATPHPLEQAQRAAWVVTAVYSLIIGPICAWLLNLVTPARWAARRSLGPLDRLLMRAQEEGTPAMLTLNTGKVYIGLVESITDPAVEPTAVTVLPMLSGYRDAQGRMELTTDYEAIYESLDVPTLPGSTAAPNLSQFYLLIRADAIVTASQFSTTVYAQFHPGWREHLRRREPSGPAPPAA